ncbi:hypothetical protein VIGAN_01313700, partial [Vigna angularis var. angularis]
MRKPYHDINEKFARRAPNGIPHITKRVEMGELLLGFKLAASAHEEHHAVVSEEGDEEEHEQTRDPTRFLEAVRETKHARTHN